MVETKLNLGGLEYFHFSTLIKDHPSKKFISGFGNHQNRKLAAIKCAAETIERLEMLDYFSKDFVIPIQLQTTNGWAVHSSLQLAKESALSEALERHLLLKSFLLHGWSGFKLIQKIESESMTLFLTVGKYTYQNKVSILVAAKSKKYNGVSFGYGLGHIDKINDSDFWLSAIFEASDRILVSEVIKKPDSKDSNWIRQELYQFLVSPFDFSVFEENTDASFFEAESELSSIEIVTHDLAKKMNLNFPFYSAFAKSDDLIPLFTKRKLNQNTLDYLLPILNKHQIFQIPESHPIL